MTRIRLVGIGALAMVAAAPMALAQTAGVTRTPPRPEAPYGRSAQTAPYQGGDYHAERGRIWHSPAMVEARRQVLERSRRSVQFGPQQAQQYLSRLQQASPAEMRAWLQRYQAQQASVARGLEVERAARQAKVGEAIGRIEGVRRSYSNINQGQTAAALAARDRYQGGELLSRDLLSIRRDVRGMTATAPLQQDFNPFAPNFDPASPDAYTRYAAASSLPGDLPASDSRNFIRGEEGISTGESAPAGAAAGAAAGAGDAGGGTPP